MAEGRPLGPLQWAVIALAVATGLIHMILAFQFVPGPDATFILNGLGYFGLVALLYLPVPGVQKYHKWVGWVLIVYTAITVAAWVARGLGSPLAQVSIDLASPITCHPSRFMTRPCENLREQNRACYDRPVVRVRQGNQ